MKKFILHIIIGLILIVLLNQLAVHSARIYKDGASIVCEQKRIAVRDQKWSVSDTEDKINILYFGASGILSAIIPEVFDSLMKNRTYSLNLALPALPIGPYYHYLKDFLKHNPPPEYIIMTYHVDGEPMLLSETYGNQGINFPGELFSYFIHRKDKNQIVNYLLPLHVYRGPIFKYLYYSLFDPSHIQRTKKRNDKIVEAMIEDRGYYFIREQSRFPDGKLPADYRADTDCPDCKMKLYDPESDVYVDKFFKLTEKLNTEVLLVMHPVRRGSYKQFDSVPDPLQKLMRQYENISIPSDMELPFYENRYFSDPHHLNSQGAIRFTGEIAEVFRSVYDIDYKLTEAKKENQTVN
jgi:hypothetical protein